MVTENSHNPLMSLYIRTHKNVLHWICWYPSIQASSYCCWNCLPRSPMAFSLPSPLVSYLSSPWPVKQHPIWLRTHPFLASRTAAPCLSHALPCVLFNLLCWYPVLPWPLILSAPELILKPVCSWPSLTAFPTIFSQLQIGLCNLHTRHVLDV
jgi:hypothetical protein